MLDWLKEQWRVLRTSYDPDEATASCAPMAVALGPGAFALAIVVFSLIPSVGLKSAWSPLALLGIGACLTLLAWQRRGRGNLAALALLVDNGFYAASFMLVASTTNEGAGIGVAVALALVLLGHTVKGLPTPLPLGVVIGIPLAIIVPIYRPPASIGLILIATFVMTIFQARWNAQNRARLQREAQLEQALGAADRIADASTQAALSTMLLSLGHFLHELRNYQTAIATNLEFLATAVPLSEATQQALDETKAAQTAEQELVRKTIQELKQRALPVNAVFRLSDVLRAAESDSSELLVERGEEIPFLLNGNPEHLRIVLHNLIRNAAQAGARKVRLEARLEPSGDAVRLLVHDDGPGLPSEHADMFQPFAGSTKAEGTGLGLYLCRRYVELFGGTVAAEPGPMGGAAFAIRLPGKVITQTVPAVDKTFAQRSA